LPYFWQPEAFTGGERPGAVVRAPAVLTVRDVPKREKTSKAEPCGLEYGIKKETVLCRKRRLFVLEVIRILFQT
jgi:hypothetical protein